MAEEVMEAVNERYLALPEMAGKHAGHHILGEHARIERNFEGLTGKVPG